MNRNRIFLDNGATTKVDSAVVEAMQPFLEDKFGNPSSSHSMGGIAESAVENARKVIANTLGAHPSEIVFTSGGTESNNFAIKSAAFTNREKGNHIVTTKIEHPSVLECCEWLEKQGFEITYLDVDEEGFVSLEDLENAITDETILVSIIHANNEIGTIQDLKAIGRICNEGEVLLHTDACQSFGKVPINVKEMNVDLISLNAHKIHGPKGIGALYIKKGANIDSWQHGGGQENRMRSGTENVPAIVGFAEAVRLAQETDVERIALLRDRIISELSEIDGAVLNGPVGESRLCNNVNFVFEDVNGEALGRFLESRNIFTSVASACSALSSEPSHVLKAIGLSDESAKNGLRITLSRFTTDEEVDLVIETIREAIIKLKEAVVY